MNTKDYETLIKKIKSYMRRKGIKKIIPEDIISEAYVRSGGNNLLNTCFSLVVEFERESIYRDKTVNKNITQKTCECCKKMLPVSEFGITQVYRYNGEYFNSNCRSCAVKISQEWYVSMKKDKEKYKAYRKRVNKNKRDWRKRRKELGLPAT